MLLICFGKALQNKRNTIMIRHIMVRNELCLNGHVEDVSLNVLEW